MVGGAICGNTIRRAFQSSHEYLEVHDPRRTAEMANILLVGHIAISGGECTQHSIISSGNTNCQMPNGVQNCDLFTKTELTLKGIDFKSCLWFEDSQQQNNFQTKKTISVFTVLLIHQTLIFYVPR